MARHTNIPESLEERFWQKVNKTAGLGPSGECWEWIAAKATQGYGTFKASDRQALAHRFSYEMVNGAIGDRKVFVCHKCDNPLCVNPAHLFTGSHQDNVDDKMAKGRHYCSLKTVCKAGHPLTEGNVYISAGKRSCKQCKAERGKARRKSQIPT